MNKEQFQGQWNQFKGKIKEKWGKLTDDDLIQINGKREQLLGKLQQKYGFAKEKAEEELTRFESSFSSHSQQKSQQSGRQQDWHQQEQHGNKSQSGRIGKSQSEEEEDTTTTHGGKHRNF